MSAPRNRLVALLWENLLWWLAPMVILLVAFGVLLYRTRGHGSPFIYSPY